jgi:hypothetical protein
LWREGKGRGSSVVAGDDEKQYLESFGTEGSVVGAY